MSHWWRRSFQFEDFGSDWSQTDVSKVYCCLSLQWIWALRLRSCDSGGHGNWEHLTLFSCVRTSVALPVVRDAHTLGRVTVSGWSGGAADTGVPWTSRRAARPHGTWRTRRAGPAFSWWTWIPNIQHFRSRQKLVTEFFGNEELTSRSSWSFLPDSGLASISFLSWRSWRTH